MYTPFTPTDKLEMLSRGKNYARPFCQWLISSEGWGVLSHLFLFPGWNFSLIATQFAPGPFSVVQVNFCGQWDSQLHVSHTQNLALLEARNIPQPSSGLFARRAQRKLRGKKSSVVSQEKRLPLFLLPFPSCVFLWCVHLKPCNHIYIYNIYIHICITNADDWKLKTSLSYSDLCLEGFIPPRFAGSEDQLPDA